MSLKKIFKRNSHNLFFKILAGFGRNMYRLYENRNHNHQSNGEVEVIKKLGKMNVSVMVDGGANAGTYSGYLHQYNPGATIYAFEPVASTFERLKEKVKTIPQIIPVRSGLFSEKKTETIYHYQTSTHSSIYPNTDGSDPAGSEQINLIKGDDWMQENGINQIDFLKLDLEGAEYEALKGFENALRHQKIRAIQFEYGYVNIQTQHLLYNFYQFLEPLGYVIGKVYPKKVEFRKYEWKHEDFIGPNFIAVLRSDTTLIQLLSK